MDPEIGGQAPGGVPESRTGAFSLGQSAAKFNALTPRGFSQHSVLQQPMPSTNGMGPRDAERIMPGMERGGRPIILPSQNGTSSNSWEQNTYRRLQGADVI
jgi:hypothetical protein